MFILHNIYIHYGPNTETAHIHIIPCPLNKGEVEVSCKKYYWLVKEETIQTYDHSIADEDNFQCQCGCDTHRRHHLQSFYFSMDYRILNIFFEKKNRHIFTLAVQRTIIKMDW